MGTLSKTFFFFRSFSQGDKEPKNFQSLTFVWLDGFAIVLLLNVSYSFLPFVSFLSKRDMNFLNTLECQSKNLFFHEIQISAVTQIYSLKG
jgi:hypothetical protein